MQISFSFFFSDESIFGSEPNTVSLRREIAVKDYNDNAPQFIGRPYSTSVSEETPVGSIIEVSPNIMVTDPDEGKNAEITLTCLPTMGDSTESDDNICDIFDVVTDRISDGNFTAIITLLKPLDFESRSSYILTLLAVDGSPTNRLQSIATISINVVDKQVGWLFINLLRCNGFVSFHSIFCRIKRQSFWTLHIRWPYKRICRKTRWF